MISNNVIRLLAVSRCLLLLAIAKPFVIVRAGIVGVVYSFSSIVGQVDEAKLARAEKEALANQRLSASLTPLLVQHEMIEKLSEKIQIMVVPQGQNFLMQLPSLGVQK